MEESPPSRLSSGPTLPFREGRQPQEPQRRNCRNEERFRPPYEASAQGNSWLLILQKSTTLSGHFERPFPLPDQRCGQQTPLTEPHESLRELGWTRTDLLTHPVIKTWW